MNTIIHLAGEQSIPVYMGVMQFDCPKHILAVTSRTRGVGETVSKVCERSGREVELLELDAYDMASSTNLLERAIGNQTASELGFNLTGGTKPMFAAAYKIAQQCQGVPFYIETGKRTVDWLDGSGRREPLRPTINTVDTFIRLAGYETMPPLQAPSPLNSQEGMHLLDNMWKDRQKLQVWYRTMGRHTQYPGVPFCESPTNIKGLKVSAELKGPQDGYKGTIRLNSDEFSLTPWPDLAKFICGGWLEDYLFSKVDTLRLQHKITDLCENLYVTASSAESTKQVPFQEFDLAFSDGFSLTIAECKAGDINQGHVQKLENLTRRFGGHFGRGILIAGRADRLSTVSTRIKESNTICAVTADLVARNPECLLTCKPGEIHR